MEREHEQITIKNMIRQKEAMMRDLEELRKENIELLTELNHI